MAKINKLHKIFGGKDLFPAGFLCIFLLPNLFFLLIITAVNYLRQL